MLDPERATSLKDSGICRLEVLDAAGSFLGACVHVRFLDSITESDKQSG